MKDQHIQSKNLIDKRKCLAQAAIDKYVAIWSHTHIRAIIDCRESINELATLLDQKGISYRRELMRAMEFSPLEDKRLKLPLDNFKQLVAGSNVYELVRMNEDLDIILAWVNDGHLLRNLRNFIASKNYLLASYDKPKSIYSYDPDFCCKCHRPNLSRKSPRIDQD